MGRPKSEEKKSEIIHAATELFLAQGYSKTSMDEVAQVAGVSKQTVYSHFKNKETLFQQVVILKSDELAPAPEILEQQGLSVQEVLTELGYGFTALLHCPESIGIHRIIISEATRDPTVAHLFYEVGPMRCIGNLANYFKQQHKKGRLNVPNAEEAAGHFFCLLKGIQHMAILMNILPCPTSEEQKIHVQTVVQMFLKLYAE